MANLGEQLLNALTLAGLLFLVSAGLSLVFGILRVVNFAHGVFYMLGAYLGYTTVMLTGWFWPARTLGSHIRCGKRPSRPASPIAFVFSAS